MTIQATDERAALIVRLRDLNDQLEDLDDRRASIKGQIEKAQADRFTTGEFADADWFRRAKGALRHLGVQRNEIARDIGEGNRRLRALNASLNQDSFYKAVLDVVDDATWSQIIRRHQELRPEGA